jgi:HEAT repeat protein
VIIAKLKVAQAALVLLTIFTSVYPFSSTQLSVQERQEWERLIKRFTEPHSVRLLATQLWGEIHGGGLQISEEMRNLLTLLDLTSGRRPAINTREFKNRIASFLNSDNDDDATFAATLLGVAGDLSYAAQVAKLLDKPDPPADAKGFVPAIASRASAAYALSLMGAKEYVPKVRLMLKSKNDYDRAWAVRALRQFRQRNTRKTCR